MEKKYLKKQIESSKKAKIANFQFQKWPKQQKVAVLKCLEPQERHFSMYEIAKIHKMRFRNG